jgi:AcrR family transcriptional regulator
MATDLRVIKTRKNIYDALMILMAQKSFEEIKVSEICDQAMINRSTFYAHFEDKYELLDSLINDLKNSLITRFKKNDIQEINKQYFIKFISLFLDEVEENKELYHMIINSNKNSVAIDMVLETLRDQAIEDMKSKGFESSIPIEVIVDYYLGGLVNMFKLWMRSYHPYTKEEMLNYVDKLLPDKV